MKNRLRTLLAQRREEIRQEAGRVDYLFSDEGLKILWGLALSERSQAGRGAVVDLCSSRGADQGDKRYRQGVFERMPTAQLIQTVPGFGIFLAVLVTVEVEDIERFEDMSEFHAYAGVIPLTHSSSERSFDGKIIKEGLAGC